MNNITHKNRPVVLSVHWGFSPGGIGKYATLIELVGLYSPIKLRSVCIICEDWQTDQSNLEKIDAEIIHINSRFDFSWIGKLSLFFKKMSPDIIISHGFNGYFVTKLSGLARQKKIVVVSSYHGRYHATTIARRIFGILFNMFAEHYLRQVPKGVICVSHYSKKYLSQKGVDSHKLSVIHNGIENRLPDISKYNELRNEWRVTNDDLLFGVVSRLDQYKGIEYLIDALYLVKQNCIFAKLVVIGSGIVKNQLQKQVDELGLTSKVIFTGFRNDIDQCLGAIDVFVAPSLAENHSIAILEAMRAAKPIIATDVGGNTESVRHLQEAIIIPAKDPVSLAEAMKTFSKDETFRRTLGLNARERFLEKFTVEVMVKNTANWFMDYAYNIENERKEQ